MFEILFFIKILFLLLVGHSLADFALQTEIMAKLKNRHNKPDFIPNGQKYVPTWKYWMLSHSLIHGGMVFIITNSLWLGIFETVAHFCIDMLKCDNYTNPHQDQLLHFICKIFYTITLSGL